jgi:hypothetical protein
VLLCAPRDNAEPAACPRRYSTSPAAIDHGWIHFVFGAVAIDRGARRPGDDRSAASLDRSPHQTINERILERCQRRSARGRHGDKPLGIVASRMRDRKKDR